MKTLHTAWYNHKPGEEITDISLTDSLTMYFHEMDAIGDLMMNVDTQSLSDHTFTSIAWMLMNKAEEAESLVEQWHKQHHGNVTQLTPGDQS